MASWYMHLRVGDALFGRIAGLGIDPLRFAFGLVAPDCGLRLPDGSYEPSKEFTHYGHSDDRRYARFIAENLAGMANSGAYAFLLGCYLHIVTDTAWVTRVVRPQREAYRADFPADAAFNAAIKAEWDALDALHHREHGAPRLLERLLSASGVPDVGNTYLPRAALDDLFLRLREQYGVVGGRVATRYLFAETLDGFVERFVRELSDGMPMERGTCWMHWHEWVT